MESSKNQIDLTNAEVRVRRGSNFGSAVQALLSKMVIVGVPAIGVLLLFAALAGTVPPEVNEAHYHFDIFYDKNKINFFSRKIETHPFWALREH